MQKPPICWQSLTLALPLLLALLASPFFLLGISPSEITSEIDRLTSLESLDYVLLLCVAALILAMLTSVLRGHFWAISLNQFLIFLAGAYSIWNSYEAFSQAKNDSLHFVESPIFHILMMVLAVLIVFLFFMTSRSFWTAQKRQRALSKRRL